MRREAFLLAAGTLGCAAIFTPARVHWPAFPDGHFMSVGGFLQVTGTAKLRADLAETRRKTQGQDAAVLDAKTRLRSYLDSLPVPGFQSAFVKALESDEFAKKLSALVQSAAPVETHFSDGRAAVVIRLPKNAVNSLLETHFE